MTAAEIWTVIAPYVPIAIAIALTYAAIRLLGDTAMELVRAILAEIRGAFAGHPLEATNIIIMLIYVVVAFALFVPSPVSEMVGLARHEAESETMQLARLGAACFVFFLFVVAGCLCVKVCRSAP